MANTYGATAEGVDPVLDPPGALGSNQEREEITLPESWTKEDLKSVTLYGSWVSPPCVKIRAVLAFYEVPYTHGPKAKPDSEYKKMPVLDVNDIQINDSFVMVKALAPVLQGSKLNELEAEIENLSTYGLMLSMEQETAASCSQLCACACGLICKKSCCTGCLMGFFSCCICCCVGPKMKDTFGEKAKEATGHSLKSSGQYGEAFSNKLGELEYFHGSGPGIEDAALYGTILAFKEANLQCCDDFFAADGMRQWWERMSKIPSLHPDKIMSLTEPMVV